MSTKVLMFKLQRYYSVASLLAVLVAATLLTWIYREVAVHGIVQLAERSNLVLARAAMNPIKPSVLEFLKVSATYRAGNASPPALPPELAASVKTLMLDPSIVRIKIYNRRGTVAFSTRPGQTGSDQSRNPGFLAAMYGGVASALIYRDTFNIFDGTTEGDNLTQTYIPVRASPVEPVMGVFEIYTDVNRLVRQAERTEFMIMVGAILVLTTLYATLTLIVRRAHNIIELQERTINERTETLKVLSAQMLKSEEMHKQKIATELHEGLAQTLAALKLQVENGWHENEDAAAARSADSIVPLLQDAIREVRTIATDLRPPSLDDLGLLPTLYWLCREFEQRHRNIHIVPQISLNESEIPAPLKVILYRIIVSVLDDMAQHTDMGQIHLALRLDDDTLVLLVDDTAAEALDRTATPLARIDPQLRAGLARMEELTTLSGGIFTASHHSGGGTTLRAAWEC